MYSIYVCIHTWSVIGYSYPWLKSSKESELTVFMSVAILRVPLLITHTLTHTVIHIYIHTHSHTCIHTQTHSHIQSYICIYIHTQSYTQTHTHTHTHIHKYTYIYTVNKYKKQCMLPGYYAERAEIEQLLAGMQ